MLSAEPEMTFISTLTLQSDFSIAGAIESQITGVQSKVLSCVWRV